MATDKKRREAQTQLDINLSESKKLAAQIGALMKQGKKEEAESIKTEVARLKDTNKALQEAMDRAQQELTTLLCAIPNIPYDIVPEGNGAGGQCGSENGRHGNGIAERRSPTLGTGQEVQSDRLRPRRENHGGGFPRLSRKRRTASTCPHQLFLDEARKSGYEEIMPPTVVNEASGYGTGQLPDKEGQMYHCNLDDFYLIPTAEVPVTNIYRDVILDEKDLPVKNCAYTQCFRREAGSYGKDVRGLNRLHEFSKVELVRIDKPEHSEQSHQEMLAHVEGLLQKLELPYRILRLCGGDMSFTSSICYDFEVYSEAQKRWLEVSSVSNFDTYQANRLKCRYRRTEDKKTELCHTLNGSALALPRIAAAIMENNQTPEGIRVPKCLVPYCGFEMLDDQPC